MMRISVQGVGFDIDTGAAGPADFVLGVRKSGSSMFNRITVLLARTNGRNFVDVAERFFASNIPAGAWVKDDAVRAVLHAGNVYGGFRNFPVALARSPIYRNGRKVFLYRDPRDALVSEYSSNAFSHGLPPKTAEAGARERLLLQRERALAMDINAYVRGRCRLMRNTIAPFRVVLDDPRARSFRYEDIIFDKARFIAEVAGHFGWTCGPEAMADILRQVDVKPDVENPKAFPRRVTPGDHREKLNAATIAQLNEELAEVLEVFGYPR